MAGNFDTYTQVGQAEDVHDDIYNVSPIDGPVASMARTIRATAKLHEWNEDSLQAAGANAQIEGADASFGGEQALVPRSNYCQIMTKTAQIAGTLEEVKKYGRDSEMAYQLELRYGELVNDEELAMVGAPGGTRQTASAGTTNAARTMESVMGQIASANTVDSTAITTYVEFEDDILEAHEAAYNAGARPDYGICPPRVARHISKLAASAGRERDFGEGRAIVNVVDLYVSPFGQFRVVLDRHADRSDGDNGNANVLLLLDFNYLATPVLRATRDFSIAKTGDSEKRQIIRESTCAVLNQSAHAMVDNIPATLA